MNLKKIKAMPFAPFRRESMERWRVTVKEPVVDGERLLVVDFLENTACNVYARNTPSFRIVCAKKSKEVRGINHEGRIQQKVLDCFSGSMWWNGYVLISPREEEALRRFLKAEKTENHQMDNLCKWIKQTRQEMKKRSMEKRGELMDEDYRLCPEALPEGMIDYIRREVLPEDRVIIYKKGNVLGTCSVCGANEKFSFAPCEFFQLFYRLLEFLLICFISFKFDLFHRAVVRRCQILREKNLLIV